jgi:hypothetical protein
LLATRGLLDLGTCCFFMPWHALKNALPVYLQTCLPPLLYPVTAFNSKSPNAQADKSRGGQWHGCSVGPLAI